MSMPTPHCTTYWNPSGQVSSPPATNGDVNSLFWQDWMLTPWWWQVMSLWKVLMVICWKRVLCWTVNLLHHLCLSIWSNSSSSAYEHQCHHIWNCWPISQITYAVGHKFQYPICKVSLGRDRCDSISCATSDQWLVSSTSQFQPVWNHLSDVDLANPSLVSQEGSKSSWEWTSLLRYCACSVAHGRLNTSCCLWDTFWLGLGRWGKSIHSATQSNHALVESGLCHFWEVEQHPFSESWREECCATFPSKSLPNEWWDVHGSLAKKAWRN